MGGGHAGRRDDEFQRTHGSYARNGDGNPTSTVLRLVERFRLRDASTLQYDVLVDDPRTWVRPWKVAFPLRRDQGYVLHEYACHEATTRSRTSSAPRARPNKPAPRVRQLREIDAKLQLV